LSCELFAVGVDLVPVHDEFTVCIFPADLEALAFEAGNATAAECPAITGDEADPVAAVLLTIHEGGGVAAACGDGSAFADQIEILDTSNLLLPSPIYFNFCEHHQMLRGAATLAAFQRSRNFSRRKR
jgi:hypothetical protein